MVLPKIDKKAEQDRYPDLPYGIGWGDFKPKKGKGKKGGNKSGGGAPAAQQPGGGDPKTAGQGDNGHSSTAVQTNGADEDETAADHMEQDEMLDHNPEKRTNGAAGSAEQGTPSSPRDSGEESEGEGGFAGQVYHDRKLYEKEERDRMRQALPAELLALPSSSRWDDQVGKASFLHAVDAVLDLMVGDSFSCKNRLLTESLR